jgi:hypothetical protein
MSECCENCGEPVPCGNPSFKPESQSSFQSAAAIPSIAIAPNSGLYINSLGQLDVDCAILGTRCKWPVGPTNPAPTPFTWSVAPSRITEGQQATINVSGLLPFAIFTVRMTPGVGPVEYIPLKADSNGNVVNVKVRLSDAQPAVVFTPIYPGGVPNTASFSVEVLACGAVEECTCQGGVTVTPFFSDNNAVSGQSVTLLLVVKNTNSCPINAFNLPALSLPSQFTSAIPVSLTNETVQGKGSSTFEFVLQVQNISGSPQDATVTIPSSSATFTCGGNSYSAGGGAVTLTIAPASGFYCGLSIETFAFTPTSVPDNTTADLTVVVSNVGSSPITNLAMPQLGIGGVDVLITAGATSIGFAAIPTLAPGAAHTETVSVTYQAIGSLPLTHVVTIPAGYIYGTCNGSQISNGTARNASISLT